MITSSVRMLIACGLSAWLLGSSSLACAEAATTDVSAKLIGLKNPSRSKDHEFFVTLQSVLIPSLHDSVLDEPRAAGGHEVLVNAAHEAITTELKSAFGLLSAGLDAEISHVLASPGLPGLIVKMSDDAAKILARDPRILKIAANFDIPNVVAAQQAPTPSWGLDRIDQRDLPLDHSYGYNLTGFGVNVWVLDSGIRATHQDFGGRASLDAVIGVSPPTNGDCRGHGTQVASVIGGTIMGVAKGVRIHAVDNVDCAGGTTFDAILYGLNYIAQNAVLPAVVNISQTWWLLAQPGDTERLNYESYIAGQFGYITGRRIPIVLAAGNGNFDTKDCSKRFPVMRGANDATIVVAASNESDGVWNDSASEGSGLCPRVDLFAPGANITTDWNSSDTATNSASNAGVSGTSLAAPHVTGVVAQILENDPNLNFYVPNLRINGVFDPNNVMTTSNKIQGSVNGSSRSLLSSLVAGNTSPGGSAPGPGPTQSEMHSAISTILNTLLLGSQ